eukprot:jgi/Mesvir1/3254/Mv16393-RA.1
MLEESDRLLAQELQDRETAAVLQHLEITQGDDADEAASPVHHRHRDSTPIEHGHHGRASHRRHRSHGGSSERLAESQRSQNPDASSSRPSRRPSRSSVRQVSGNGADSPQPASAQDATAHAPSAAAAPPVRSATMVIGDVLVDMEPGKCYGCRTFVSLPEGTRTFRCLKCGASNHVRYHRRRKRLEKTLFTIDDDLTLAQQQRRRELWPTYLQLRQTKAGQPVYWKGAAIYVGHKPWQATPAAPATPDAPA